MNERIKELAIQAGFFYEDYKDIWYLEYHNQSCEEEMKKFAELIVRECVNICDDIADPTLYREAEYHARMAPGASYASKVIKLRFSELKNERTKNMSAM